MFTLASGFFENLPFIIYIGYYFGFMILASFLLMIDYSHEKNRIKKEIEVIEIIGGLLMLVPTLIFMIILPYLRQKFPSVLCAFAIFMAISSFITVYLENKIKSKRKSTKLKA
jgi:low temperature requirement protein LtrA